MDHITTIPVFPTVQPTESAIWHLPSKQEYEIANLAAQCQLKQQQREPLDVVVREEEAERDVDDDLLSCHPTQLTTDSTKQIKMEFLDRLAELVCREKHASYVTCTSMTEYEDQVTIVIARNATWEDTDREFLNTLACIMESISSKEPSQENSIFVLRELFANYYLPRLQYHTDQLIRLVEHHVKDTREANLVQCGQEFLAGMISPIEFVTLIHGFSQSTNFKSRYTWVNDKLSSKKLQRVMLEIAFLCRPEIASNTCFDAARDIPSFQKINIQLLTGCKPKKVQQVLSATVQSSMTPKSKQRLQQELDKVKWVHAEMRMITYLLNYEDTIQLFPYLGVSKKTFFLCGHVLKELGMFSTRANHGKMYSQWTLPSWIVIRHAHIQRWERAVNQIPKVLCAEVDRQDLLYMDAAKESTTTTPVAIPPNVDDPFTSGGLDPRRREIEAGWFSKFSQRPRVLETENNEWKLSSPSILESDPTLSEEGLGSQAKPAKTLTMCSNCGKDSCRMIFCSKCQSVTYCDNDCRKSHWMRHKFFCLLGRPLDEADFLVQSCQTGEYPDDENTLKAFGFWHFKSGLERVQLFQLYCKLVNHGVGDKELREAWQRDKLKEFILFCCLQLSPFIFERERIWIGQQQGFGKNSESGLGRQLESIPMFLSAEDKKLSFSQLEPEAKRMAYLFYGQILNQFVPAFDEDNWVSLGFCTARNQKETQWLAHLYSLLIKRCTFEEFWKAMDNSTMVELFRTYNLGSNISRLRNFETLMQGVGKWHQSVWELKKFTQSSENMPTRSVYTDYGFQHCQSAQERIHLCYMYTEFFARGEDEMKLHQACINGRLAEFLKSKLGPLKVPDEVLSNDYPIEGCTYMGMTAKSVIMCPESIYPVVLAKQEAEGGKELIITIPDEQDETMRNYVQDQAAFTTGRMRVTKTMFHEKEMTTMNVDW